MKITKQLLTEAKKFYKKFGNVVPLRELPETTTTEEVVDVIRESLTTGENLFPERFGLHEVETSQNIIT